MMLLRLVRIGMGLEEIADNGQVAGVTPAGRTPNVPIAAHGNAAMTPCFPVVQATMVTDPVEQAIEEINDQEDVQSTKEEIEHESGMHDAAEDLTLFPPSIVDLGMIEIASSSESESESSSSDSSSSEPLQKEPYSRPAYEELIPEGLSYYKHVKSQRVHCSETEASHTKCKLKLNNNYKLLGSVLTFKYPKCLRCFPNDPDRVRTREQAAEALDAAIERVREAKRRRT